MTSTPLPNRKTYTHPKQLLELTNGWFMYESKSFKTTAKAINTAIPWMWILFILNRPNIFPTIDGGVLLQWVGLNWEFEILIEANGKVDNFYLGRED